MTDTTLTSSRTRLPGLIVSIVSEGVATVVVLRGEADAASLPAFSQALDRIISVHQGPVIVDLAETRFIDSATVRALSRAAATLDRAGRPLSIRAPSRTAAVLLDLIGISPPSAIR